MRLSLLVGALALSVSAPVRAQQRSVLFRHWLDAGGQLWTAAAPPATLQAVSDFKARRPLASGKVYGDSVRGLPLDGKTGVEIDRLLKAKGFVRHDDVIRDPVRHEPIAGPDGSAVPMLVYTHEDGGLVRVKPSGDPTSKVRPQPDVVKSVRNPPDGDYRDFDKEAFKLESAGDRPLPKWPRELFNPYQGTPLENEFVDGWGDAAHGDVALPAAR